MLHIMKLSKIAKKLLLLQRNELLSKRQVFYRKKFGRFLFTNFFIHLNQKKNLTDLSFELFEKEYNIIKNYNLTVLQLNIFGAYVFDKIRNILDI